MVTRFMLALALAITVCGVAAAQTTTSLLDDNFDSYTSQTDFENSWGLVGTTPSNFLQTEADAGFPPVTAPNMVGHATIATRNQKTITETGNISASNTVKFSFDFYDTASASFPYRQHSNLQDGASPTGTNQLVSMGLMNTLWPAQDGGNYYFGRILGYTPTYLDTDPNHTPPPTPASGSWFKLNEGSPETLRKTGWTNLRVEISSDDGQSQDYKFYVDDILAKTINNVGAAASVRSYEVVRLGSGLSSLSTAYTDNIKVEVVTGGSTSTNADFDADGDVDGRDFLAWQRNLGISDGSATLAQGDANDDGNITQADLDIFKAQFGEGATAGPAVAAIPEPTTLALGALAVLGGLALGRRK